MNKKKQWKIVRAILIFAIWLIVHLILSIVSLRLGISGVAIIGTKSDIILIIIGAIGILDTPILSWIYWFLMRVWDYDIGD